METIISQETGVTYKLRYMESDKLLIEEVHETVTKKEVTETRKFSREIEYHKGQFEAMEEALSDSPEIVESARILWGIVDDGLEGN